MDSIGAFAEISIAVISGCFASFASYFIFRMQDREKASAEVNKAKESFVHFQNRINQKLSDLDIRLSSALNNNAKNLKDEIERKYVSDEVLMLRLKAIDQRIDSVVSELRQSMDSFKQEMRTAIATIKKDQEMLPDQVATRVVAAIENHK